MIKSNQRLSGIFEEIADFLEMDNIQFRPEAYRRAGRSIRNLNEEIEKIYQKGGIDGLKEIPGVGDNLALKIEEFLKEGKIGYHQTLKKKKPLDIEEILRVEGLGPRRAKDLYYRLGVANLADLEKAAREGKSEQSAN